MKWPFENDTSMITNKIASADLKQNKLQTRLSILAITLATMLLISVLLLMAGTAHVNYNKSNPLTGSYHGLLSGVTKEQYHLIKSDQRVETTGVTAPIAVCKDGNRQLNLSYGDAKAIELCGHAVEEGRHPEKENEILIERDYLRSRNLSADIGDSITLHCSDGDNANLREQKFVISGYLKTSASGTNRTLYGAMVSQLYFEKHGGWSSNLPSVLLRIGDASSLDSEEIEQQITAITKVAQIQRKPWINTAYLNLSKPSLMMIFTVLAALFIILAAGMLVIYCIFYISIVNAVKEFGQLRTIGMTGKQIRHLVFREGSILCRKAIPIGLIIGSVLSYCLIPEGFQFKNLIWAWPLTILLIYLTVRFSVVKPAKIAAGASPIEASRWTMADEKSNQNSKSSIKRITPKTLAKAQFRRNKKKNLLTICSLALTGVLLLSASSVLTSMDAEAMSKQGFPNGQFTIGISEDQLKASPLEEVQVKNPLTGDLLAELKKVSGVEKVIVSNHIPTSLDENATESDADMITFDGDDMAMIRSCLQKTKSLDYEEIVEKRGLIIGRPESFAEDYDIPLKIGNRIAVKVFEGAKSKVVEFTIVGILDQRKAVEHSPNTDMFMIPTDTAKEITDANLSYEIFIQTGSDSEEAAEAQIRQILQGRAGVRLNTLSAATMQNENFLQGMKLALTIVIVLIGCFTLMNLVNTILTGIVVRRQEFSIMRSVGMTQRQLTSMVQQESLITSAYGLILSLLLGGITGFGLCMMLKQNIMTYMEYHFPYVFAAVFVVIVIISTLAVTKLALKNLMKSWR